MFEYQIADEYSRKNCCKFKSWSYSEEGRITYKANKKFLKLFEEQAKQQLKTAKDTNKTIQDPISI